MKIPLNGEVIMKMIDFLKHEGIAPAQAPVELREKEEDGKSKPEMALMEEGTTCRTIPHLNSDIQVLFGNYT